MRVRAYRSGDRGGCLEIFDSNVPEFFRPEERRDFSAFLDDPPGPLLVLEGPPGWVVGFGGVADEGDGLGSLCWGMVHRRRHGQGLGRRLLDARLDLMRQDPAFRAARLETIPATAGFFVKMGFSVVSTEPDGYAPGMDRVVLVRDLEP